MTRIKIALLANALIWNVSTGIAGGLETGTNNLSDFQTYGAHSTKQAIYYRLAIDRGVQSVDLAPDIDGLLFELGTTNTDAAREALVELLDVYLGEGHINALLVAVTLHGKSILPQLKEKLSKVPISSCQEPEEVAGRGPMTWCLDDSQIKHRIERAIESIESDEIVEYVW